MVLYGSFSVYMYNCIRLGPISFQDLLPNTCNICLLLCLLLTLT